MPVEAEYIMGSIALSLAFLAMLAALYLVIRQIWP